ncbi:MAG: ParB N-terminal domain-containing protein [Acidobacteriaceae bacterium]|nr:ParB N-terminal domain-containing protein [Acidobacteriaceae bacterium]
MDSKTSVDASTLTIRGREVPVLNTKIEQDKLRFYPENPRVYSVLHGNGEVPSQSEIQKRLLEMEHVKVLIQDIERNKGLIEPLIVRNGTFEVLEGNSRLAAYRFLAKSDPVKWGYIKCTVIPQDIDESLVFALLGQFHIKGKKDWAPYEQAGFLYRRFKKHNADLKTLANEIGISSKHAKHLVDTYQFMLDHNVDDIDHWSYFDEYLKSNKISRAREKNPQLDSLIVGKIKSEEILRAVDLRDYLPVICSAPKVLAKFVTETYDFDEACDAAVKAGGDSEHFQTVKRFREWITRPSVEQHLMDYDGTVRSSTVFELRKIESRVRNLLRKLEN